MKKKCVIIILVFIVAGGGFMLFRSEIEKNRKLKHQFMIMQKQLEIAKRKASILSRAREELEKTTPLFDHASAAIPDETQYDSFVDMITEACRAHHITLDTISRGKERKADFFIRIPVSIKCRGRGDDLAGFLNKMSQLPRITTPVKFRMVSGTGRYVMAEFDTIIYRMRKHDKRKGSRR